MSDDKPDFRKYIVDSFKRALSDPKYVELVKIFIAKIEARSEVRGTRDKPEQTENYLTGLMVEEPKYQELIGVHFIERTVVRTTNAPFDITGNVIYIHDDLRKKYNIRKEDSIVVEVKTRYSENDLMPDQLNAARNGLLNAVIVFCGTSRKFVEGTYCPIISLQEVKSANSATNNSIYGRSREDNILESLEMSFRENPYSYPTRNHLIRSASDRLRADDPHSNRNFFRVILHMTKDVKNRKPLINETLEDFKQRIFNKIEDLMSSKYYIKDLDPYGTDSCSLESTRGRYPNRKMSVDKMRSLKKEETLRSGNLFDDDETCIYKKIEHSDGSIKIIISPWIVEKYSLTSQSFCISRCESIKSHIVPEYIAKIENCYTPSPYMRRKIKIMYKKYEEFKREFDSQKAPSILKIKLSNNHGSVTRRTKKEEKLREKEIVEQEKISNIRRSNLENLIKN